MKLQVALRITAIALPTTAANAQTVTGAVEGHVTDPAGATVPAATVRAKAVSTGTARAAQTNSEGFYEFAFVGLGDYELTVDAPGFQSQTGRVNVALNRTTVLNFRMAVAGVQESVTVSEAAPAIDLVSGQIRRSIEEHEIEAIPLGRNMLDRKSTRL